MTDRQVSLLKSITNIGSKESFIEFNINRITDSNTSLMETQNTLEATDMAEATMTQKIYELSYNASLQMASQMVPMSIFNFM
jgi:flagellar hook-associated protein 3 FlgL